MLNALMYNILSVQIVYSVHLNCTYSNYAEAAATFSAGQQERNCQTWYSLKWNADTCLKWCSHTYPGISSFSLNAIGCKLSVAIWQ